MDRIVKNRWQVRLAALVIFLLGAAAGALALNVYHSWTGSAGRAGGGPSRGGFERMLGRLELSAEQEPQVRQILADARTQMRETRRASEPRMEEIRRQTDERLQKVLTPEQWQRFQQLKQDMRPRRRGGKRDEQ